MKNIVERFALIFSVFFFAVFSVYPKTIVIYHTSDIHGWYNARPAKYNNKNPHRLLGGFAALASLVKKEPLPFILVDSGDWFQGTALGIITKGRSSITLMNELGYTAAALGNHEYDFGQDNLKKLSKEAKFKILAANIENGEIKYAKPYTIRKIEGVKIGIIGVITPSTKIFPPYVSDLKFTSIGTSCNKYIKILEQKNVDAIIVLAHNGLCNSCARNILDGSDIKPEKYDYKYGNLHLAGNYSKAPHIVFGGHYHTGLKGGYYENGTLFVESASELTHTSRVELKFDDDTNEFISAKSELIPLWIDETGEDLEISKKLKSLGKKLRIKLDKPLARAESNLTRFSITLDTPLGNWITDAIAEIGNTDIAFQNSGGIRADIYAGDITLRHIYQVLPFENTIVTVEITGKEMKNLIKQNIKNQKSFMQVSGLEILYSENSKGIPDKIKIMAGGKNIDLRKTYKVATSSYLTCGGSGGWILAKGKNITNTKINMRQAVVEYLKKNPIVKAPPVGRIKKVWQKKYTSAE